MTSPVINAAGRTGPGETHHPGSRCKGPRFNVLRAQGFELSGLEFRVRALSFGSFLKLLRFRLLGVGNLRN